MPPDPQSVFRPNYDRIKRPRRRKSPVAMYVTIALSIIAGVTVLHAVTGGDTTDSAVSATTSLLSVAMAIMVFVVAVGIYIAPMIIANSRKHPNEAAIAVVNLLLGWTIVGYVVALAWAVIALPPEPPDSAPPAPTR